MTDLQRLKSALTVVPSALALPVSDALRDLAAAAVINAQSRLPPGPLAESLAVVSDADGAAVLAANDPAAVFVEYGTRTQDAHPFLRPAAESAAADGEAALAVAAAAALRDTLERS